jgi:hypothetical protein
MEEKSKVKIAMGFILSIIFEVIMLFLAYKVVVSILDTCYWTAAGWYALRIYCGQCIKYLQKHF